MRLKKPLKLSKDNHSVVQNYNNIRIGMRVGLVLPFRLGLPLSVCQKTPLSMAT